MTNMIAYKIKSGIVVQDMPEHLNDREWYSLKRRICDDIRKEVMKMFSIPGGCTFMVHTVLSRTEPEKVTLQILGQYYLAMYMLQDVEQLLNEVIEHIFSNYGVLFDGSVEFMPINMGYEYNFSYRWVKE